MVGKKSIKLVGWSTTVLAFILSGHLIIPGTRIPPSNGSTAFPPIISKSYKGQIISKELFCVLKFSKNPNEQIRRSSKNEFVRSGFFFGEYEDTISPFEII